jgi:hypothetical protein
MGSKRSPVSPPVAWREATLFFEEVLLGGFFAEDSVLDFFLGGIGLVVLLNLF